jgi:hypothetical protein
MDANIERLIGATAIFFVGFLLGVLAQNRR